MTLEAYPEVAALLRDAGWKPHDGWGVYTRDTLVMGFQPDGQGFHVKNWAKISEGDPQYSADTPDTAEEAAAWLVARYAPSNPLEGEATLEPPVYVIPVELVQVDRTRAEPEHGEIVSDRSEPERDDGPAVEAAEPTGGVGLQDELGGEEPGDGDAGVRGDDYTDADFDVADLGSDDLLGDADFESLAIEGADAEPEAPAQDGPIAYGASTIDGLIREKLGRVSQIARELKAVLQEGWTVEEYAYLQNLMVRMDRGEAPDDQASRERFLAIAAKSQAMSRIDAVRDRKEGELEEIGQRRDFDAAVYYEPGEGWPA